MFSEGISVKNGSHTIQTYESQRSKDFQKVPGPLTTEGGNLSRASVSDRVCKAVHRAHEVRAAGRGV